MPKNNILRKEMEVWTDESLKREFITGTGVLKVISGAQRRIRATLQALESFDILTKLQLAHIYVKGGAAALWEEPMPLTILERQQKEEFMYKIGCKFAELPPEPGTDPSSRTYVPTPPNTFFSNLSSELEKMNGKKRLSGHTLFWTQSISTWSLETQFRMHRSGAYSALTIEHILKHKQFSTGNGIKRRPPEFNLLQLFGFSGQTKLLIAGADTCHLAVAPAIGCASFLTDASKSWIQEFETGQLNVSVRPWGF